MPAAVIVGAFVASGAAAAVGAAVAGAIGIGAVSTGTNTSGVAAGAGSDSGNIFRKVSSALWMHVGS